MLCVEDLHAAYDSAPVLRGVSFGLAAGEVLALLGRNGVGKTTLLRALVGLMRTSAGEVHVDGVSITRMPTHRVARLGLTLVPQGRGILGKLSVRDNLVAGLRAAAGRGAPAIEEALGHFPALGERLSQLAGTLSGGQQQQLAIARALCGRPRVLLLDEPSEGIQPNIVQEFGHVLTRLAATTGVAVLLVEQNIDLALRTANRCLVMEKGRLVYEGKPDEFRSDAVLRKYLAI